MAKILVTTLLTLTGSFVLLISVVSASSAKEYTIGQRNNSFVQSGKMVSELTVKKGDVIRFRNEDPYFHNVFSLSKINTFDLGSYPKGQSKQVTANKTGTMEVECAIHPQMFMKVLVQN